MIAAAVSHPAITPEQSLAARIEELKKTVSASKLNCWRTCRLKFYFRYVLKIKRAQSAAQFVGSMVHFILQTWNLARWRNQPFDLPSLKPKFESNWQEKQKDQQIRWDGEEIEQKQTSWSLVQTYFRQTPIPVNERPEAVEVFVEADLEKHGLPIVIGLLD